MLKYEYYNAELLQNTALKIADTVGLLTPPAGQAFGVLSALTNLETVSSTLIENYSAVRVHTLGVSVPTEDAVQAYVQDIIEHDVPSIDKIIIKSATIPTASADLLGAVYQYVGQTDGTYEHGYIYECVAETTTETLIMFDPVGTGKLGFDYQNHSVYELFDRIAALTTPTFDPQDVVSGSFRLDKANELWYISGYDANGNALFTDFTVEATGGEYSLDGYGYIYTFPFPDDYEDGHTENFTIVQDQQSVYSWERIDVQPNSEAEIAELQAEVAEIQSVIPAQASASNQLADKAYVQTGLDSKQDNLTATDGLTLNNNVISGKTLQDDIADINTLIPNQATAQNQLADKNYVQSGLDGKQNISTDDYQMGNASGGWTTMTTAQQNALNSGATTAKINAIATNTQAIADEVARATGAESALSERITANTNNFANYRTAAAQDAIDATLATKTELGNETSARQNADAVLQENIDAESTARESADNALQTQIDAIVSKSDVVDIVGTYAELQAYDTSALGNNDVVKVISDSTHNNAPSYYRWVITGGVGAWVYIGSESASYTKAETDALLNEKQDTLTTAQQAAVDSGITTAKRTAYDNHLTNTDNPHSVTKAQVGLSNVDNTSDLNKPISTATQEALDGKQATISDLATIRSGAALGATAVQPADLATVATSGSYNDLSDKISAGTGINIAENNVASVVDYNILLKNIATGSNSLTLLGASTTQGYSINIGVDSSADSVMSLAIGRAAIASANYAIQIGAGTNSQASSLGVGFWGGNTYTLLDGTTGLIPTARLADTTTALQGQVLTLDANMNAVWASGGGGGGGGSVDIDGNTITKNTSNEIQAVAVIDQNTGVAKTWTGTKTEYDAIATKDPETEYLVTDDIGLPATEIGRITEALNNKMDIGTPLARDIFSPDEWVGGAAENILSAGVGFGTITFTKNWQEYDYLWFSSVSDGSSTYDDSPHWVSVKWLLSRAAAGDTNLAIIRYSSGAYWYVNPQTWTETTMPVGDGQENLYINRVYAIKLKNITAENVGYLNYVGNFATVAALNAAAPSAMGQWVIVDSDENHGNLQTKYFSTKNISGQFVWSYGGVINVSLAGADYVVESQEPTVANNYTWYRKYKSGWVEQGGTIPNSTTGADYEATVNLPVEMADAHYQVVTQMLDETYSGTGFNWLLYTVKNKTVNSFKAYVGVGWGKDWIASGMAA